MIPTSELLGSAIRHAVCAGEGNVLIAADLGSIETRVCGWFTGCKGINRVFAEGLDSYKDFATTYFNVPYDQVTKQQRNFSKPPVLGGIFGLGWRGMIAYAEGYGVDLDEEKAKRVVDILRTKYHEVPTFWSWIEAAVIHTVTTGQSVFGYKFTVHMNRDFLNIRLPSGRDLWYFKPEIRPHTTPWGEVKPTFSYMGLDDKNRWVRLYVHPGLICENCLSGNTEILTDRGWISLREYQPGDLLWDGVDWVHGGSLLDRGIQTVIEYEGVQLTKDHLILAYDGWRPAEEYVYGSTTGPERYEVRIPSGGKIRPHSQWNWESILDLPLRVWGYYSPGGKRLGEGEQERDPPMLFQVLSETWEQEAEVSWTVQASGLRCMAVVTRQMRTALSLCLSQLWRARNHCVRQMAYLRRFLVGYGEEIQTEPGYRTYGQRERIFPGKLPMAVTEEECQQQKGFASHGNPLRGHDGSPGVPQIRNRGDHSPIPIGQQVARKQTFDPPRSHQQRVYDIANVGPRNRFTVRGGPGKPPFVVHNCTQALARDFLAYGMKLADEFGELNIVLHVHDEIVCEVPEDNSQYLLEVLIRCMTTNPPWAPNIILGAEGYIAKRYRKD